MSEPAQQPDGRRAESDDTDTTGLYGDTPDGEVPEPDLDEPDPNDPALRSPGADPVPQEGPTGSASAPEGPALS